MLRAKFFQNLGQLHYFLGIKTSTTINDSLHLSQTHYICDHLKCTNMLQSDP